MTTKVMGTIQRQINVEVGQAYTGEPGEPVVVLNYGTVDAESNQVVFSEAAAERILAALKVWAKS